jgi:hypothetical protein
VNLSGPGGRHQGQSEDKKSLDRPGSAAQRSKLTCGIEIVAHIALEDRSVQNVPAVQIVQGLPKTIQM